MAKYVVTKQIDFGPYTVLGKSGLQSDQVPLNNYAPKVGDVIEGEIKSQVRHGVVITGIPWQIATNGPASIPAQRTTQIVPMDNLKLYVEPAPQPVVEPVPSNPRKSNKDNSNKDSRKDNGGIMTPVMLRNILIVIGIILLVAILAE